MMYIVCYIYRYIYIYNCIVCIVIYVVKFVWIVCGGLKYRCCEVVLGLYDLNFIKKGKG